jgi:gliding motility-associated-like protein
MKHLILFLSFFVATISVRAQAFNFQLTGNPLNTTGWVSTGSGVAIGDLFQLTSNTSNQAGSVYYGTPQNLTNCSQFTVTFDFRITLSSAPTADGIAFYYISNPPTGFTTGGGLGLPSNPNGLLLLLDTYDNNGTPAENPLVALRKYDGTVPNYVEGSSVGQLAPDVTGQTFITDGNWHTCVLSYYFGTITVAFDGNPPVISTTTTLSLSGGYFGFSAGTGALWAKHDIKNVFVTGAPEPAPPAGADVTYCQGTVSAPLTAAGTNLKWYTVPTGGTALPSAPTPSTSVAGTFNWYVTQGIPNCNIESLRDTVIVTINPKPATPTIYVPSYCSGQTGSPITITTGTNVLWYNAAIGGTSSPVIPVVNATNAGDTTWYVTQTSALGCESDRAPVTATVRQSPVADYGFNFGFSCSSDTVHFQNTTTNGTSYYWDFNDAQISNDTNPTHIYTAQGTYNVKLRALNAYCKDSVTKPVVIAHGIQAAFAPSADIVCEGGAVSFANNSNVTTVNGIAPVYFWYFGDGSQSGLQNPSYTYTAPGSYQVMLVAQNGIPCTDTAYAMISVDSLPSLKFKINDTAVCKGTPVVITAQYVQSGLNNLIWNFGDSPDQISDAAKPVTHGYDQAGVYTVTATADYRACPDEVKTAMVTVKAAPHLDLGPDTAICLDGVAYVLSDAINAANPAATWLWSNGATTSSIEVKHQGTYTGTVTIDQCSTSDVIEVRKDCYIDIPNSFTPNGDGVNDYFLPRQLLSSGVVGFNMNIFDRWGQKVFETANSNGRGWDGKFNGKDQPNGVFIYDIKVFMKNGRTEQFTGNVTLLR